MINCVLEAVPPARCNCPDIQLVCDDMGENHHILCIKCALFSKIITKITHFTNCFMQCRQNTVGTGNPTIQHCILFIKKLARFLKDLRTSNMCRENTDAVKIGDMNDFGRGCQFGMIEQKNVSFSNTPAGMDAATSIKKNNFNDITTTSLKIQGENAFLFKTISGITKVLFLQRPTIF